jgi:hypothetical protein
LLGPPLLEGISIVQLGAMWYLVGLAREAIRPRQLQLMRMEGGGHRYFRHGQYRYEETMEETARKTTARLVDMRRKQKLRVRTEDFVVGLVGRRLVGVGKLFAFERRAAAARRNRRGR